MPLTPVLPGRRHDETEQVIRHHQRTLERVLDFLGYTIHDVVNDPRRREHVRRAFKLSRRIDRDLAREPWRTEATKTLAAILRRRLDVEGHFFTAEGAETNEG